jgi:transposase
MAPDRNSPPKPPATLEDAYKIIVALWHEVMQLREENAALKSQVADLEEKLKTNSSNSSMPPSSDSPSTEKKKKKNKKKKGKRGRGGQPGHEGKTRELVPKEDVDEFVDCTPDKHCECGGHVLLDKENPERHQKLELPEVAVLVLEYLIYSGVCLTCGKIHRGKLPGGVPSGMLCPRAMATVSVLSGKYHLSKRSIEEILSDLFGLDICLGTVSNTEARVSDVLEDPVEEAKEFVKEQGVVHADETGHKVAGKKAWMWVAVTSYVSVFLIRCSRGQQVALELLGEAFGGFLVSDRWGAYNWIRTLQRQLCWAHLIRDFTKISERAGLSEEIGNKLLKYAQKMFHLWHLFVDGKLSRPELQLKMAPIRRAMESLLAEGMACGHANTERTCKKILHLKEALWTFVDVPGVEPTNNLAERTIRPYVLWRKASFGTQSERGNQFVERMMTVSATCKQQNRNVIDYVTEAIRAHLRGDMIPSLLPDLVLAEEAI